MATEYDHRPDHYSARGGHKNRSEFWRTLRLLAPRHQPLPDKAVVYAMRRFQPRFTSEGKR